MITWFHQLMPAESTKGFSFYYSHFFSRIATNFYRASTKAIRRLQALYSWYILIQVVFETSGFGRSLESTEIILDFRLNQKTLWKRLCKDQSGTVRPVRISCKYKDQALLSIHQRAFSRLEKYNFLSCSLFVYAFMIYFLDHSHQSHVFKVIQCDSAFKYIYSSFIHCFHSISSAHVINAFLVF